MSGVTWESGEAARVKDGGETEMSSQKKTEMVGVREEEKATGKLCSVDRKDDHEEIKWSFIMRSYITFHRKRTGHSMLEKND